jgi:hypothetical protein
MSSEILLRGFLFGGEFVLFARKTDDIFAVPRCFADFAESEGAVFAYCETFGWWGEFAFRCIGIECRRCTR